MLSKNTLSIDGVLNLFQMTVVYPWGKKAPRLYLLLSQVSPFRTAGSASGLPLVAPEYAGSDAACSESPGNACPFLSE